MPLPYITVWWVLTNINAPVNHHPDHDIEHFLPQNILSWLFLINLPLSAAAPSPKNHCYDFCQCGWVLPIIELHVNGARQKALFCVWILCPIVLLSSIPSCRRSMHCASFQQVVGFWEAQPSVGAQNTACSLPLLPHFTAGHTAPESKTGFSKQGGGTGRFGHGSQGFGLSPILGLWEGHRHLSIRRWYRM